MDFSEEDIVDLGQPGRKLADGTYPGTILTCQEHFGKKSGAIMIHVDVSVQGDPKLAPEGAVLLSAYLPAERTDKIKDLSKLGNFLKAMSLPLKGFTASEHVGKPIRVVAKWVPSRDQQYADRAEIIGFLPPLKDQKPISIPKPVDAAPDNSGGDPFAGEA